MMQQGGGAISISWVTEKPTIRVKGGGIRGKARQKMHSLQGRRETLREGSRMMTGGRLVVPRGKRTYSVITGDFLLWKERNSIESSIWDKQSA